MQQFITNISERDTWNFQSTAYFNVIWVDGLSGTDGAIYLNGQNVYGILSGNAFLISELQGLSGNWQDTYSIVQQNSADWISTYTTVQANSSNWTNSYTKVASTSANWDSVYSTVKNTSGDWESVYSTVKSTSGDWESVYSSVNNTSANWNSVYSQVCSLSSVWVTNISALSTYTQNLSTAIRDLSGKYLTIVDAGLEYQAIGSYLSGNSVLTDLSDVTIASPDLDQILKFNGTEWINGSQSTVNGGAGIDYFYYDYNSDISPYLTLNKTPFIGSELLESVSAVNEKVLLDGYLTPLSGIGGTQIDAGVWTFDIWGYVDVMTDDSHIICDLYTRNLTGGETFLFGASSGFLTDALSLFSTTTIQPEFPIIHTDRLLIKIYGQTNALVNRTIYFVHGGNAHYSHFNAPLITRHNDLAGLQGGGATERYHLNLNTYNNLNNNLDSIMSTDTQVRSLSSGWAGTQTTVNSNSGRWENAYTNLVSNSAAYLPTGVTVWDISGNFIADYGMNLIAAVSSTSVPISVNATNVTIKLGVGTFYVGDTNLLLNDKVNLIGSDRTTTLISFISTVPDHPQYGCVNPGENSTIANLSIINTTHNNTVNELSFANINKNNVVVESCDFYGGRDNLALDGGSITFKNCTLNSHYDNLIMGSGTNTFENCRIITTQGTFDSFKRNIVCFSGTLNIFNCEFTAQNNSLMFETHNIMGSTGGIINAYNSKFSSTGGSSNYNFYNNGNTATFNIWNSHYTDPVFGIVNGDGGTHYTSDLSLVASTSGNWNSTYTTVQNNSSTTWLGDSAVDSLVHSTSANWNNAYTNLTTNSAAYLTAVDISLIASTSGNWNSTYTTVNTNSATTWLGDSAVDSLVHNTSATWNNVSALSQYLPLSGGTITGNLSALGTTYLSGDVGIGTTTPNEKLTVSGNISASGTLSASNIFSTTSVITPKVIGGNTTTSDLYLQTTTRAGVAGADMHFLVGNNGGTEAITILNNGNVGIGTASPTVALEVNGDLLVNGANGRIWGIKGLVGTVYFQYGGDQYNRIETTGGQPAAFRAYHGTIFYGQAGIAARIGLSDTNIGSCFYGDVGIGTTTPNEKLTVSGNISASGNISTNNISVSGYQGYTHPNSLKLTDSVTGGVIEVYLRGGILTLA